MRKSETVAYNYLLNGGYKKSEIDFSPIRSIDFLCSDGRKIEVKSLIPKQSLIFTEKQWNELQGSDVEIMVVNDDRVIHIFSFSNIKREPYKISILHQDGLKPHVDVKLLQKIKRKFPETEGMTATGLVDWALRYLLKLKQAKYMEA